MSSTTAPAASFEIPLEAWEDAHGDASYLLTNIQIGGLDMHLEAIEVEYSNGDAVEMRAVNPDYEKILDCLYDCGSLEGRPHTATIEDKEYIVLAHPYCM